MEREVNNFESSGVMRVGASITIGNYLLPDYIKGAMTLHGIEIDPIWESTSTQAIVRAVQASLGISVLPYLFVDIESKSVLKSYFFDRMLKFSLPVR